MDSFSDVVTVTRTVQARPGADGLAQIGDFVARHLPGDDLLFTDVRFDGRPTQVYRHSSGFDGELGRALDLYGQDHPAIRSYVGTPGLAPRRVSDVSSLAGWVGGQTYVEAFRARGERFQLSVVLGLEPPVRGRGWIVTRTGRDFTDAEMELAARLQPLLVALDCLCWPRADGVDELARLTARELQILAQLASGATAARIARTLGLTERTVRKHLEHVYAKLECHDRLVAVDRAKRHGLIPPSA